MKRARLCINSHSKCIQDRKPTLEIGKACRGRVLLGWLVGLASFFASQSFKEIIPDVSFLPQNRGCCVSYGEYIWGWILKIQLPKLGSQIHVKC